MRAYSGRRRISLTCCACVADSPVLCWQAQRMHLSVIGISLFSLPFRRGSSDMLVVVPAVVMAGGVRLVQAVTLQP